MAYEGEKIIHGKPTVLRTTLRYKLASKLTGAGGGGCVLTLLPTRYPGSKHRDPCNY